MIDTFLAAVPTDTHINALINAVLTSLGAAAGNKVLVQSAAPTASGNAATVWVQHVDGGGKTVMRAYFLINDGTNTYWRSRHPMPPGTIVFVSDIAKLGIVGIDNTATYSAFNTALATYDGGGTPGTGAMWEIATELQGKFPLSVDPAAYPFQTVGGEAAHTLSTAELPNHTHDRAGYGLMRAANAGENVTVTGVATERPGAIPDVSNDPSGNKMTAVGGGNAHNNMPPFYSGYFLRRTTRTDYVVVPS